MRRPGDRGDPGHAADRVRLLMEHPVFSLSVVLRYVLLPAAVLGLITLWYLRTLTLIRPRLSKGETGPFDGGGCCPPRRETRCILSSYDGDREIRMRPPRTVTTACPERSAA